nr:pyridoxamine 5'-phosphate oxidase family protein [Rhizobium sp. AN83]
MTVIRTVEELKAIYDGTSEASIAKVTATLTAEYRQMIEASPFLALATVGPEGMDCSPRGDKGGVVRVADDRTVLLPDWRGNNRVDLAFEHRARSTRGADVPDPGIEYDDAHQRPRCRFGRTRSAAKLRNGR